MSQDLLICFKIAILDMDKILKPLAKISQTLCAVIYNENENKIMPDKKNMNDLFN